MVPYKSLQAFLPSYRLRHIVTKHQIWQFSIYFNNHLFEMFLTWTISVLFESSFLCGAVWIISESSTLQLMTSSVIYVGSRSSSHWYALPGFSPFCLPRMTCSLFLLAFLLIFYYFIGNCYCLHSWDSHNYGTFSYLVTFSFCTCWNY